MPFVLHRIIEYIHIANHKLNFILYIIILYIILLYFIRRKHKIYKKKFKLKIVYLR